MSRSIKYSSKLTSVTSFSGNFDAQSLSARPQLTRGNTLTTLTCGFSGQSRTFEGYSFDSVESVLLSCQNNTNVFVSGGDPVIVNWPLSGFTSISTLCDGTTLDPPISGIIIGGYTINSYSSMTIKFPEISATGNIDVLLMNAAGYGSMVKDLSTTITIN